MYRDEFFKIYANGKEFEIPKASVNFQYGYAAIEKVITKTVNNGWGSWCDRNFTYRGIIDENYKTVFDFEAYYTSIQIFPEGNIIIGKKFSGGDGEQSYSRIESQHYKIKGMHLSRVGDLVTWSYKKINETTIQTENDCFNYGFEALYDVVSGQFISEKFTKIRSFKKANAELDENLAEAIYRIPYNDGTKNVCEIICYIDEAGSIRTPLYSSHTGEYIKGAITDFSYAEAILIAKAKMEEDEMKKSKTINSLVKVISPKDANNKKELRY